MPRTLVIAVLACVGAAAPAIAQTRAAPPFPVQTVPDARYQDIAAGRYDRARSSLEQLARTDPDAPEVALNLAAVHVRTGRPDLARPLYARVLSLPSMAMDMPDGDVESSHAVAMRAMRLVGTDIDIASR